MKLPLALVLLLAAPALATSAAAQTQTDLNAEACGAYARADGDLNAVYQEVLAAYADDAAFVASLREAQRAWVTFRDLHMASRYPGPVDEARLQYGSAYAMCSCSELTDVTEARTAQLRRWLTLEEGEVCSGSARPLD